MKKSKSKRLYKLKEFAAELIAPSSFKCLNCGCEIFDDSGFCGNCKKETVYNNGKVCPRCGVGIDGEEEYCGNCAFDKIYFDKGYSVFSYEGAIKNAILKMKFANMGRYAKVLARYLTFMVKKENITFDIVCYTPMTPKAKRQRGYNQSQLLAEYLCDYLDKQDAFTHALIKIKETARQESLSRADRKTNLIGAYKVAADVKGKRVLVIDDVKTTGSTLNECAKALKLKGAVSVECLTVASRKEHFNYELENTL